MSQSAPSSPPVAGSSRNERILAIDWLRSIVMILMTLDHASHAFNAGRLVQDGVTLYDPRVHISAAQFWVRFVTHLCLPMFMFLAGLSLAISTDARQRRGETAGAIDQHLLGRGVLLLALDWVWMSWVWSPSEGLMLGVLSAIGLSFIAMVGLRHLSSRALLAVGATLLVTSELICGGFLAIEGPLSRFPIGFLLTGRHFHDVHIMVSEPPLPWLPALILGWVCQKEVFSGGAPWRRLTPLALFSLAVFALVRWFNGYGNMRLLRSDSSLVQYLRISKYPASLSYLSLELGIGVLILAFLLWLEAKLRQRRASIPGWTILFGQTSLCYYLLHVHLLQLGAWACGLSQKGSLPQTALATAVVVLSLYPTMLGFHKLRQRYPRSILRFL